MQARGRLGPRPEQRSREPSHGPTVPRFHGSTVPRRNGPPSGRRIRCMADPHRRNSGARRRPKPPGAEPLNRGAASARRLVSSGLRCRTTRRTPTRVATDRISSISSRPATSSRSRAATQPRVTRATAQRGSGPEPGFDRRAEREHPGDDTCWSRGARANATVPGPRRKPGQHRGRRPGRGRRHHRRAVMTADQALSALARVAFAAASCFSDRRRARRGRLKEPTGPPVH
jgi:hypothetical protein